MTTFSLQRVQYVPKELSEGVLYVSDEYAVACHLCACGCGNKVTTPLGLAEWTFTEDGGLPTLRPSIGNWQLACRSHYFITDGLTYWAGQWSDAEIIAGRRSEQHRRQAHYESLDRERGFWTRLWVWVRDLFGT